jgi:hypothetical protein
MCNTFGILVLVACITALFAQQQGTPPARIVSSTEELLGRRLKAAESERQYLFALTGDTKEPLNEDRLRSLTELDQLRQALEALREQSKRLENQSTQSAIASAEDPAKALRTAKNHHRDLQREVEALKNTLPAMNEQIRELEARESTVAAEKARTVEARTVRMRFPREHDSGLKGYPIIVRYGKIYPLTMMDGSDNPEVAFTPAPKDGKRTEPVREKGWTLAGNRSQITELFQVLKDKGFYVSLYAYPDSFEQCRQLRQFATEQGLQFGLGPVGANERLIFSKTGRALPAL